VRLVAIATEGGAGSLARKGSVSECLRKRMEDLRRRWEVMLGFLRREEESIMDVGAG